MTGPDADAFLGPEHEPARHARRPGRQRRLPRPGLAARFGAVGVLTVLVASLVLGVVGARIVQGVSDSSARKILRMVADADAQRVKAGLPAKPDDVDPTALDRVAVQRATIRRPAGPGEARVNGAALARTALSPNQIQRVLGGNDVSEVIRRDGVAVFVEARPTPDGGIVVAQRRPDGLTQGLADEALPRWAWAATAVAVVGALLAGLLAWWTGRPLRRLVTAAADLAAGRRDVALPERGPAEVATLAAEVNALAAALARAEARQREFLMSVSHDLRTPLTTLQGYAETLADPDQSAALDPTDLRSAGAVMLAEAGRLERMVADLLMLARLEADEVSLHVVPSDAAALVRETARAWAPRAQAAGLTVAVEIPAATQAEQAQHAEQAVLTVLADPDRLRQALDNLLENAVRVCPPGAGLVVATRAERGAGPAAPSGPPAGGGSAGDASRAEPHPPYVVLEVRDGGPGLSDDDAAVAFERGALSERYRGRREVGTGLGLTLVDRLVRRMGGTVTAGRAPEGGALFAIRLPAAPEPGGAPAGGEPSAPGSGDASPLPEPGGASPAP